MTKQQRQIFNDLQKRKFELAGKDEFEKLKQNGCIITNKQYKKTLFWSMFLIMLECLLGIALLLTTVLCRNIITDFVGIIIGIIYVIWVLIFTVLLFILCLCYFPKTATYATIKRKYPEFFD